jgi:hypothetical protein
MVDQARADRSEQDSAQTVLPSTAHNHHLGLFRQVDKCGHWHRKEQITVDFRPANSTSTAFGDLDRIRNDLPT